MMLLIALFACGEDPDVMNDSDLNDQDSLNDSLLDTLAMDSLIDTIAMDTVILSESQLDNALDDILDGGDVETIEGAMSFCDCIRKISEIEEAMFDAEPEDWPQYEDQMNALKNGECAIINAGGGITTAEDKQRYQKMVDDCLDE